MLFLWWLGNFVNCFFNFGYISNSIKIPIFLLESVGINTGWPIKKALRILKSVVHSLVNSILYFLKFLSLNQQLPLLVPLLSINWKIHLFHSSIVKVFTSSKEFLFITLSQVRLSQSCNNFSLCGPCELQHLRERNMLFSYYKWTFTAIIT